MFDSILAQLYFLATIPHSKSLYMHLVFMQNLQDGNAILNIYIMMMQTGIDT